MSKILIEEAMGMPDCWVVVKNGQIIATHNEPSHLEGIQAVRYVPALQPFCEDEGCPHHGTKHICVRAAPKPAQQQEPTCKQDLQIWVQRTGQFSWEPQDERFWTRMQPAQQQEPVPPSAYESLTRDMTTIAARQVPRGVPIAEFAMHALADAELREHAAAAPQPAQQCKWPTCQSEKVQQALADEIQKELVGTKEPAQQQEPVAWVMFRQDEDGLEPVMFGGPGAAPDPATLKDRFVLKDVWLSPPAQRTWVGLSEEEIEDVWRKVHANDFHDCVQPFAQAIEAKLKEKNT